MGGAVSLIISVLAVVAFAASGSTTLAIIAIVVVIVCLWSWLHMWYFARVLARQRLFVAALQRGEFEQGSPEAERYWNEMQIQVDLCDATDIPNWITMVNMVAAAAAVVFLVWGAIAYWSS